MSDRSIKLVRQNLNDSVCYGKVVVSLRETIRLMGEVDGVIESAGGWAVK
jgi:hypothetical protein